MNGVALRLCTETLQIIIKPKWNCPNRLSHFLLRHPWQPSFFKREKVAGVTGVCMFEVWWSGEKAVAQMKGFPTFEEVEKADKEQLARWYRFLPSGETAADQKIMKRIAERFEKLGGMTAELSKKIGM
jgi:hypothetical protein